MAQSSQRTATKTAAVPSTMQSTDKSPTCLACGKRFDKINAPTIDFVLSVKDTPMMEKMKSNKKNKVQDEGDTPEVNKTIISGVLKKLGNLLKYISNWIPGYQLAKEAANNLSKRTSPIMSFTIFSAYTITSSNTIFSITKKTKRPKHKKKPRSAPASPTQKQSPKKKKSKGKPASPIQKQPAKSKPAKPDSPSRLTCCRCQRVFTHRNKLFKHLNSYVDLYEASSMPIPKHLPADDTNNAAETAKAPRSPRFSKKFKRSAPF